VKKGKEQEKGDRIFPTCSYTHKKLALASGLSGGAVRYMDRGNLFDKEGDFVKGESFIRTMKSTKGLITLYEFLQPSARGNMTMALHRHSRTLDHADPEPFFYALEDYGGERCYFVEEACVTALRNLFKSGAMDRRRKGFPARVAMNDFGYRKLSRNQIVNLSDGLTRRDVDLTIDHAKGFDMQMREVGKLLPYVDFINALQNKRYRLPRKK